MPSDATSGAPAAPPLLETDALQTFVAIAETASFTRGAQRVFRTPSAVSMKIKRLEEMLGRTLFVREARRVRLTPEGEVLLGDARRLLQLNGETVARFLAPALSGRVRIGTSDDVGSRILPAALGQFARTHPTVEVEMTLGRSGDLAAQLDAGALNLALVTAGNDDYGADAGHGETVHTDVLVWAQRRDGDAGTRAPLPLALASQGCVWRRAALAALDRDGRDYRIAYTSEHCGGQQAAMLADLAVAPFPRSLVRAPLQVVPARAGLPPLGEYQIVMLVGAPAPAVDALAEVVRRAFRELRRERL
ncbi:LysR family transcriptional regulator [Luteimonas suaedae]|uniref:LysR family transcriptional regulator n=1 Tax=Luteimonas suaedae TaxID=2605430 RepID=UPI0011ECDCEE|nr:LysR family transcriptional regulator [Luteimonas suaedae]